MKKKSKLKADQDLFSKKLLSYSVLAGVVMSIPPTKANATIVYTDIADVTLTIAPSEYLVDFDGGGHEINIQLQADVSDTEGAALCNTYDTGFLGGTNTWSWYGSHYGILGDQPSPNKDHASVLSFGDPISSQRNFYYNANLWDENAPTVGYWNNQTDKYLGVKIILNRSAPPAARTVHYGWIRLSTGASYNSITIKDFAYENVAGCAILAGATTGGCVSNTAPVVDLNGAGTGNNESSSFTEDGGAVPIAPAGTVTDADGDEISTVTITLTNNLDGASEGLFLGSATNVTIGGSGSNVLTLTSTGTTTNAQFQAALQAVTYNNASNTPNTTSRSITVVANDGTVDSATCTVTMSIVPNNDPPTNISISGGNINENQPAGTTVGTLSTTDPDN